MTARRGAVSYKGPEARLVRQMFASIAHRYDLLNHLLSLSIDRLWRRRAVDLIASLAPPPDGVCLDVCTGTGDLAIEIATQLGLETVAADFCHPMLMRSVEKIRDRATLPVRVAEADARHLPFPAGRFALVTAAFGVRNVESLEESLAEMHRVLRPGGALVVLEFSRPVAPVFRELFGFYFTHVLPRLGSWISGTDGPYRYLPASVGRFPAQEEFVRLIESTGFRDVRYRNLTGGVAALHWGRKPGRQPQFLTDGEKLRLGGFFGSV